MAGGCCNMVSGHSGMKLRDPLLTSKTSNTTPYLTLRGGTKHVPQATQLGAFIQLSKDLSSCRVDMHYMPTCLRSVYHQ